MTGGLDEKAARFRRTWRLLWHGRFSIVIPMAAKMDGERAGEAGSSLRQNLTEAVMASLLACLVGRQRSNEPYRHWTVAAVLPPNVAAALRRHIRGEHSRDGPMAIGLVGSLATDQTRQQRRHHRLGKILPQRRSRFASPLAVHFRRHRDHD